MSDLDEIVGGETPVEEPQAAPVETPEEPKVEEPQAVAPETPEEPPKEEPKMVPLAEVDRLRAKVRDLEGRIPTPEPEKAPDVLDDQEGFASHITGALERRVMAEKLSTSRFLAEREFGVDLVQKAYDYFDANPGQSPGLLAHPSPFHAAVEQFQAQQVAVEIGNDPAAYKAKLEAEIRAKVEAEMVAKQAKERAATPAPSMANVTGTAGNARPVWAGPTPLDSAIGS